MSWSRGCCLLLAGAAACVTLEVEEPAPAPAASGGAGGEASGGSGGGPPDPCPDGPGREPGGLLLDGSVSVQMEPPGLQLEPAGQFWVEAWVKLDTVDGSFPVLGTRGPGEERGYELRVEQGKPVLLVRTTAGSAVRIERDITIAAGLWYHLAAAVKPYPGDPERPLETTLNGLIFVNGYTGAPVVIGPETTSLDPSPGRFWIGGSDCAGGGCFAGAIDEARVHAGTLSDAALKLYLFKPTPLADPELVGSWRFGEQQGSVACDQRGVSPGRIVQGASPHQGSWSPEHPYLLEAIDTGACASDSGWPVGEAFACLATARPEPPGPEEYEKALSDPAVVACGAGYSVCNGSDPADVALLRRVTFATAEQLPGVFAFEAEGRTCGPCNLGAPDDTAAAGRSSALRDPRATGGCWESGRIQAGHWDHNPPCVWRGYYDGLLCCPGE